MATIKSKRRKHPNAKSPQAKRIQKEKKYIKEKETPQAKKVEKVSKSPKGKSPIAKQKEKKSLIEKMLSKAKQTKKEKKAIEEKRPPHTKKAEKGKKSPKAKKEQKRKKSQKELKARKPKTSVERKLSKELSKKDIEKFAKESGYQQRSNGKIKAISLIVGFLLMVSKQRNTYSDWKDEISDIIGKKITKQAVEERMTPETAAMIKEVLEYKLKKRLQGDIINVNKKTLSKFQAIHIEDSTVINLPPSLAKSFPGNTSKGKKKAQAKIHAMYNFITNSFSFLDVHSYSRNDQSLASVSLPYLQKGDLLIRDLGFLVLDVVKEIIAKEISCYVISRKKSSINVYDPKTGAQINLVKELRKNHFFDKDVLAGTTKKIPLRLVILRISAKDAERRRRKAKNDRDKRLNHSKEYYELLGYSMFLTNIPPELCNAEEIYELYRLRWRIEIIFKCWKSHLHIEKRMPKKCDNPERIYCAIYLLLIYVLLFHSFLDIIYQSGNKKDQKIAVSILKVANYFAKNFPSLFFEETTKKKRKKIKSDCKYDERNDRINTEEIYRKIMA